MNNSIIIIKGILFYDGEKFRTRLKNVRFYSSFEEANKIKNSLADKSGVETLRFWQYKRSVSKNVREFKNRSKYICQRKAEYKKYKKALLSKNELEKRLKKDNLTVFRCLHCNWYHIGSFDGYSEYYSKLIKDLSKINSIKNS